MICEILSSLELFWGLGFERLDPVGAGAWWIVWDTAR